MSEVAQSSPTLRPHGLQTTRLLCPWDSPGKNTGVGCHFFLQYMEVKRETEVAWSCPTPSDPWTADYQAPPSMGFSRQEYWSGVPSPSPPERTAELNKASSLPRTLAGTPKASLPASPLSPFAPLSPGVPLSPFSPGGPLAPERPCGPMAPAGPG